MHINAANQGVKLHVGGDTILQLLYTLTQILFTLPLPQEECSLHAC